MYIPHSLLFIAKHMTREMYFDSRMEASKRVGFYVDIIKTLFTIGCVRRFWSMQDSYLHIHNASKIQQCSEK